MSEHVYMHKISLTNIIYAARKRHSTQYRDTIDVYSIYTVHMNIQRAIQHSYTT